MREINSQDRIASLTDHPFPDKKNPVNEGQSFGEVLKTTINQVDQLQKEADNAIQEMASGKQLDIHQTMIAMEKASVSFQLMMQVRNKIVSAYEEIMRMQV